MSVRAVTGSGRPRASAFAGACEIAVVGLARSLFIPSPLCTGSALVRGRKRACSSAKGPCKIAAPDTMAAAAVRWPYYPRARRVELDVYRPGTETAARGRAQDTRERSETDPARVRGSWPSACRERVITRTSSPSSTPRWTGPPYIVSTDGGSRCAKDAPRAVRSAPDGHADANRGRDSPKACAGIVHRD